MDRMNLREAAQRTCRSVTTLRRYIRSGRLHAEKQDGRYGPEYFVRTSDLLEAGLFVDGPAGARGAEPDSGALERRPAGRLAGPPPPADAVPAMLYQELFLKHEQLLVQYGMMRAGGMRAIELRDQLEERTEELDRRTAELRSLQARRDADVAALEKSVREANFELEGRSLEIAALQEKVRALELLTRNQVTNESIDDQYRNLVRQLHRVERHASGTNRQAPETRRRPWLVRDVPGPKPDDH